MIPRNPMMIIIPLATLVASLTDPAPIPPHRLMLCTPTETDLIHRMFLAKELPALPAINTPIDDTQWAPTRRVETKIIAVRLLPVGASNMEIRIALLLLRMCLLLSTIAGRWRKVVGFEDVEPLQLLV